MPIIYAIKGKNAMKKLRHYKKRKKEKKKRRSQKDHTQEINLKQSVPRFDTN